MGFALVGYPSRPHKRKRVPSHIQHESVRIYYCCSKKVRRTGTFNKYKTVSTVMSSSSNDIDNDNKFNSSGTKRRSRDFTLVNNIPRPKSLMDLPVEVIRRIFTLGKAPEQMPLLNKFLHECLRPDKALLLDILWEKYLFSPNEKYNEVISTRKVLVSQKLFNDRLLANFFIENHIELIDRIDYFIIEEIVLKDIKNYLIQRQNGEGEEKEEEAAFLNFDEFIDKLTGSEEDKPDFPEYFYKNFMMYFQYPELLTKMNKFFAFHNVSNMVSDLLQWFLLEQDKGFSIADLYRVIDTAFKVSNSTTKKPHLESSEPLCTILQVLYGGNKSHQRRMSRRNWKRAVKAALASEADLDTVRLEFVRQFVRRYYHPDVNGNAKELLSDHMLWRLLKSISRVELIDLIEEIGGVPQYGVIM